MRNGLVTCFVVGLATAADADTIVTLEPTKLELAVPADWKVMSERAGDFLHHEIDDERTIDISFERAETCRAWRAESGGKKAFPAYWPKRARTHLYTRRRAGKVFASGCLADTPGGAMIANLEITPTDPKWKPNADDVVLLRDALAAALAGAQAVVPKEPKLTEVTPNKPPSPRPVVMGPASHRGGETVTLPQLDLPVKLPKDAIWVVGARGESKIERDNPEAGALAITVMATAFRSCTEWRVDGTGSDASAYFERLGYLPSGVGAFATATVSSACVETKSGPVGLVIEHARVPENTDALLVHALVEAIVASANKSRKPLFVGTAAVDGGSMVTAGIGKVRVPAGAQWRVTNGAIERFDKGRYFAVSAMSRPSCTERPEIKEQAFWPAGVKATVETRAGATVSKACVVVAPRAIELTLVYDGTIAPGDHALIKSLVDSILASAKKRS